MMCSFASQPARNARPSTIVGEQRTVTDAGEETTIVTKGRHDPCLLPRFVPIGEAMMAIVLADHYLRLRGQRPA